MENLISIIISGYLLFMNITGFALMGVDKKRAVKRKWRIPERTLILIAFIGGGVGAMLGMLLFHHKTKHIKFLILLPVAAILYAYLYWQLLKLN